MNLGLKLESVTDAAVGAAARSTRAYFAHRIVYPWQLPSLMRKHIYTGAMGATWGTLISGLFFVHFGTTVGMTPFQWSLMGGISSWLIAAQMLSAYYTGRIGNRKAVWFVFAMLDRLLRLAGVLGAAWLWRQGSAGAAVFLIAAVCLANLFGTMAAPPWFSWLADLIPARTHGAFWGRRAMWISWTVVAVIVPSALLVDRFPAERKMALLVWIFIGAGVLGVIDLIIHGTIPEPDMAMPPKEKFLLHVLQPLADRRFRPWLVFNMCWTFAMTMGGALASIYFLNDLGLKENFFGGIIVLSCIPLLGGAFTGAWAGRLVDQRGIIPMLRWGHLFWAVLPLFWLLADAGNALWMLSVSSVLGGIFSAAATNAATKYITRQPLPANTAMYTAVSSSLGSIAGGLGVLTAGFVLRQAGNAVWHLGGLDMNGFRTMFLCSLVLRITVALVLARRIPELPSAEIKNYLQGANG